MSSDKKVEELAANRSILDPEKQRVLWSKVIALQWILTANKLTTREEVDRLAAQVREQIDQTVVDKVKKELGLDEEQ